MEEEQLDFLLREIAISLFTELTAEDRLFLGKTIQEVSSAQPLVIINNIQELYHSLVDCKKMIEKVEFYEEFSENQGYQKALQKLDSEVRNHIKGELQMKLYVDTLEEKISKAVQEKSNIRESNEKVLKKLKEDNKHLKSLIATKNLELEELKLGSTESDDMALEHLKQKAQKNNEKINELERSNAKLKQKWLQAKVELDCKNKEYEKFKSEFVMLKKNIGLSDDLRSTSSIQNKSERLIKESSEIKSGRIVKTPTKADRSVSPLPLSYHQKIMQYAKITQSTKKLEKSPLSKILKTDLSRYKSKPRLPIYAGQKK